MKSCYLQYSGCYYLFITKLYQHDEHIVDMEPFQTLIKEPPPQLIHLKSRKYTWFSLYFIIHTSFLFFYVSIFKMEALLMMTQNENTQRADS